MDWVASFEGWFSSCVVAFFEIIFAGFASSLGFGLSFILKLIHGISFAYGTFITFLVIHATLFILFFICKDGLESVVSDRKRLYSSLLNMFCYYLVF